MSVKTMTNGLPMLTDQELEHHAYCAELSGFTILRQQLTPDEIALYRDACERALAPHLKTTESTNPSANCLYAWEERTLAILEHENITHLTHLVIGEHKLWDLGPTVSLPQSKYGKGKTKEEREETGDFWHRDFWYRFVDTAPHGDPPKYLYYFVCLVDVNAQNGATWLVPGTRQTK